MCTVQNDRNVCNVEILMNKIIELQGVLWNLSLSKLESQFPLISLATFQPTTGLPQANTHGKENEEYTVLKKKTSNIII